MSYLQITLPKSDIDFVPWRFNLSSYRTTRDVSVAILENGRVVSNKGLIVTNNKILINDLSRSFGVPKFFKGLPSILYKQKTFKEKNLAVITTDGFSTYYHWLFDVLPRIHLLLMADVTDGIDYFVLPELSCEFQKSSLKYFDFLASKIVEIKIDEVFISHRLIVPSLPSHLGTVNLWALNFLRQTFLRNVVNTKSHRKLYISRRNATTRRLLNEQDIIEYLESLNFEIIEAENLKFEDQIKLFNEAEVVVSPHGSGLSNIVFCKKNTKVIDLFYGDFLVPCFWVISAQLELDYYYATSADIVRDFDPYWKSNGRDDYFPLHKLKRILKIANIENE
jgi:hypothetical protein